MPLEIWVENALALAGRKEQAKVLSAALDAVRPTERRVDPPGEPAPPPRPPDPPSTLRIAATSTLTSALTAGARWAPATLKPVTAITAVSVAVGLAWLLLGDRSILAALLGYGWCFIGPALVGIGLRSRARAALLSGCIGLLTWTPLAAADLRPWRSFEHAILMVMVLIGVVVVTVLIGVGARLIAERLIKQ